MSGSFSGCRRDSTNRITSTSVGCALRDNCIVRNRSAACGTASPAQLLHRVEQRYNGARTLSVHFIEHYRAKAMNGGPEEGILTLRKAGKMRWDYSEPRGKLFISDGKTLYLYTADDNRVERWKLKDTEDMRAPLAFLLGHMDMEREFHDFSAHPVRAVLGWAQTRKTLTRRMKPSRC